MRLAFQFFVCFGIPVAGIILYTKIFTEVEDIIIFKIGFINTIHYLALFSIFLTLYFWGMSGIAVLGFLYLVCVAPILSFSFSYWILLHKNKLADYQYALFTSISYIILILCFFSLIYFKPGD